MKFTNETAHLIFAFAITAVTVFNMLQIDHLEKQFSVSSNSNSKLNLEVKEIKDIVVNCNAELEIDSLSKCYVNQVRQFYKYNRTDDSISLSFEELKARGGDCKDWSELYIKLFGYRGIEARKIIIPSTKGISHSFVIAYSADGYCLVDMEREYCIRYEHEPTARASASESLAHADS